MILLVGMLVMAVAYRRSFCGMLCPLGTLQGIFGAAGRKLFGRRFAVPRAVDRVARYLKYAVLVLFAVWTWQAAELVLRPYDPWVAWAHLTSADLLSTYAVGLAVLIVSLAGSLVYDRFFCKYLCPTGALLGLLSRVSFLNIRRDADACIDCGRCDKACMMNVEVATADVVRSSECISCNECVNACPVPGALKVTAPGGARAGALAPPARSSRSWSASSAPPRSPAPSTGRWRAAPRPAAPATPARARARGRAKARAAEGGSDSSIKGWMSFADIAAMTGIPLADFAAEWGVPSRRARPADEGHQGQLRLHAGGRPRVGGGPPRAVTVVPRRA